MRYMMPGCVLCALLAFAAAAYCPAEETKEPTEAVDADEAAAQKAEEPAAPLERPDLSKRQDARPGWVALSDDTVLAGSVYTSIGKPIAVFDRARKQYDRVPWKDVARVDVEIIENVVEQDWRWKEGGSDEKVLTDLYYVWHKYLTTVTLQDGRKFSGDVAAPIWIRDDAGKVQRLIPHKRNKGEKASKDAAKPPIFVKKIVLTDVKDAEKPPEPKAEAKAQEQAPAQ